MSIGIDVGIDDGVGVIVGTDRGTGMALPPSTELSIPELGTEGCESETNSAVTIRAVIITTVETNKMWRLLFVALGCFTRA
jgi:hypothetical protein